MARLFLTTIRLWIGWPERAKDSTALNRQDGLVAQRGRNGVNACSYRGKVVCQLTQLVERTIIDQALSSAKG
jgi:hypothetical protein